MFDRKTAPKRGPAGAVSNSSRQVSTGERRGFVELLFIIGEPEAGLSGDPLSPVSGLSRAGGSTWPQGFGPWRESGPRTVIVCVGATNLGVAYGGRQIIHGSYTVHGMGHGS